ncbi:hypothetical protein CJU90_6310 [Yarrowia sp. C11]|nr:hypothetical protein CJU90_6310 [Yarrowia sp. C11]KAG5371015.1 hypothetical protein CKK34_1151 [Yarrowia sp. E02]
MLGFKSTYAEYLDFNNGLNAYLSSLGNEALWLKRCSVALVATLAARHVLCPINDNDTDETLLRLASVMEENSSGSARRGPTNASSFAMVVSGESTNGNDTQTNVYELSQKVMAYILSGTDGQLRKLLEGISEPLDAISTIKKAFKLRRRREVKKLFSETVDHVNTQRIRQDKRSLAIFVQHNLKKFRQLEVSLLDGCNALLGVDNIEDFEWLDESDSVDSFQSMFVPDYNVEANESVPSEPLDVPMAAPDEPRVQAPTGHDLGGIPGSRPTHIAAASHDSPSTVVGAGDAAAAPAQLTASSLDPARSQPVAPPASAQPVSSNHDTSGRIPESAPEPQASRSSSVSVPAAVPLTAPATIAPPPSSTAPATVSTTTPTQAPRDAAITVDPRPRPRTGPVPTDSSPAASASSTASATSAVTPVSATPVPAAAAAPVPAATPAATPAAADAPRPPVSAPPAAPVDKTTGPGAAPPARGTPAAPPPVAAASSRTNASISSSNMTFATPRRQHWLAQQAQNQRADQNNQVESFAFKISGGGESQSTGGGAASQALSSKANALREVINSNRNPVAATVPTTSRPQLNLPPAISSSTNPPGTKELVATVRNNRTRQKQLGILIGKTPENVAKQNYRREYKELGSAIRDAEAYLRKVCNVGPYAAKGKQASSTSSSSSATAPPRATHNSASPAPRSASDNLAPRASNGHTTDPRLTASQLGPHTSGTGANVVVSRPASAGSNTGLSIASQPRPDTESLNDEAVPTEYSIAGSRNSTEGTPSLVRSRDSSVDEGRSPKRHQVHHVAQSQQLHHSQPSAASQELHDILDGSRVDSARGEQDEDLVWGNRTPHSPSRPLSQTPSRHSTQSPGAVSHRFQPRPNHTPINDPPTQQGDRRRDADFYSYRPGEDRGRELAMRLG